MKTDQDRLSRELLHERGSIWYAWDEIEFSVLVKAPGTAIKSLSKGCKLELLFGLDQHASPPIFHAGYRIYDHPVNYLAITGPQRFYEEHFSLRGVMECDTVRIQFHDELCACSAIATLIISETDRRRVLDFVGDVNVLYDGEINKRLQRSHDAFEFSLGHRMSGIRGYSIDTLVVQGALKEWFSPKTMFVSGSGGANTLQIDDPDQGNTLETQAVIALDELFGRQLYLNPQIPHKKGHRELTDVLAIGDYGIFLIESKALDVLSRDLTVDMERKVAGLKKQINTAIRQLIGASKKITEGVPVFDSKGKEIFFDRKLLPHCIVLVSELLPFGEWQDVVQNMMQAMLNQTMYLNVIDLNEFMYFVGIAQGSKDKLDYFLMRRCENLVGHGDIHAKTIVKEQ